MEENRNTEIEEGLSLLDLFQMVKRHILSIVLCVGIFFILMMVYSFKIQTPIYNSTATVMVNTTNSTETTANNDYIYAQRIMATYEVFFTSELVLDEVSENIKEIEYNNQTYYLNYPTGQLKSMIATGVLAGSSINAESLILAVQVSGTNPIDCAIIANEIIRVAQSIPQAGGDFSILRSSTLSRVDIAKPNYNYDKNLVKNGVIGIAIGAVIAAMYIILREVTETTVSNVKSIEALIGLNTLSIVPDISEVKNPKYDIK